MRKRLLTKADTKLLIALIVLSLVSYAMIRHSGTSPVPEKKAVIKVSGEVVKEMNFSADTPSQRINIKGKINHAVVEIKEGKLRVVKASCPDQICVRQGWIERHGQSIICVPNEVIIFLQAETEEDSLVDAITR